MPELTITHIALLAVAIVIGLLLGWLVRGNRASREQTVVNAEWQEQLDKQGTECERLVHQNKSLMEQNSQHQASNQDATIRASELSDALKEAFTRRDELQHQISEIRGNLEATVSERDKLRDSMPGDEDKPRNNAIRERDERIFRLSRELENWQERLPPLIERFKQRDAEAVQLEDDLAAARGRVAELEADILDASNEPHDIEDQEEEALEATGSRKDDFNSRDDLQLIKGVGPAIEKTLNELGIFRFSQIAELSEYDIDRVANRLKGFRSRIYREDWMGQARELHVEKTGS